MIIDLQRRIAEIGRIRIGEQVATASGKKRPAKLTTFRLTSQDPTRIKLAAQLYGGQPRRWESPAGTAFEVITETDALEVMVPPSDMAFSQHYELWSAGGCQRRCDGESESISDGACLCDPEQRECAIHTRLSVMLRDLPGLGVWRIDTSGYYAAVELQGAVQVIQMAAGRGQILPARLRLEQRTVRRIHDGKSETRRFAVPVLDIEISPGQLLGATTTGPMIEPGLAPAIDGTAAHVLEQASDPGEKPEPPVRVAKPPLTPVPADVLSRPTHTVAQQVNTAPPERKPRANAAQPIPRTGIRPRTAAQVAAYDRPADDPPFDDDPTTTDVPGARPDPPESRTQHDPPPVDVDGDTIEPTPQEWTPEPLSVPQSRKMHALFRELGITERPARLAYVRQIINRPITSSTELTLIEAGDVIDSLQADLAEPREEDTP